MQDPEPRDAEAGPSAEASAAKSAPESIAETAIENARAPAPWLVGLGFLPFGLVCGFMITTLPFLLTRMGVPLDRVSGISATVLSPTFWAFLFTPILDTGLTRRSYSWIMISVSALSLAAGLWVLSPRHLHAAMVLLVIAEFCVVLYGAAINGWQAEFVPAADRGPVGGWINVANLGGGALGSLSIMELAGHFPIRRLGPGLMLAVLAGTAPLFFYPRPAKPVFALRQVFSSALAATWKASKSRACLTGFALFLAPCCSVAAINLFSGLGDDFHTASATVIAVTGGGCAISASLGSLFGGFLAQRIAIGYVYLSAGIAAGACALALALTPHVALAFILGVLAYNACAGMVYAAFNALGLELVGHESPVASTQLALFAAAINFAIVYMTWADGQGYRHFGVRGLLLVDGLAALTAAFPLLFLVRHELRRRRSLEPELGSAAI